MQTRGECFLARPTGFGRGPSGHDCRPVGANCPHGSACVFLREHGISFHPCEATSEMLPSLKRGLLGRRSHRRVTEPFRNAYRFGLPVAGTAWDFHRSVWSAVVPRRDHQSPRRFAAWNRRSGCERTREIPRSRGFGGLGSVAHRLGRNVTPPELLLPGPSVIVRCRPMLAA